MPLYSYDSSDSGIAYSGYLLKRSNKPFKLLGQRKRNENHANNISEGHRLILHEDTTSYPEVDSSHLDPDDIESTTRIAFLYEGSQDIISDDGISRLNQKAHQSREKESCNNQDKSNNQINYALEIAAAFFGCDITTQQPNKLDNKNETTSTLMHDSFTSVSASTRVMKRSDSRPMSIPIAISTSNSGFVTIKKQDVPAQSLPNDFIDPKDGHIWRAKFCILEDGILYFYKNFEVGNSVEAQAERQRKILLRSPDSPRTDHDIYSHSPLLMDMDKLGKSPMPRPSHIKLPHMEDELNLRVDNHVLWEKRVPLEMVGAIRAAEADYGEQSFELLAIRADNRDLTDSYDDLSLDDRLILRASSAEDMNGWMLRFKESCALIMKQLVRSFKDDPIDPNSKRHENVPSKYLPSSLIPHNVLTDTIRSQGSGHASFSNGQRKDGQHRRRNKIEQNFPSAMDNHLDRIGIVEEQSPDCDNTNMYLLLNQKSVDRQSVSNPDPEIKPSSTKYIPPHLRPKSIVHLPTMLTVSEDSFSLSKEAERRKQPTIPQSSSSALSLSLMASIENISDSDVASATNSTSYHRNGSNDNKIKLGGCADPNNIHGSIRDDIYIPRKKSRVGKVSSEHFGRRYSNSANNTVIWEVGAVSDCGIRDSNEDAYLIVNDLRDLYHEKTPVDGIGIFSIFDGHSGNHTARFASERLPYILIDEASKLPRTDDVKEKLDHLLRSSISRLDFEFCELCTLDGRDWDSGATAIIVLVLDSTMAIATLGDSNGVFGYSASPNRLPHGDDMSILQPDEYDEYTLQDRIVLWKEVASVHSPGRDDERNRIELANGWITTEQEIPIAAKLHRMDFFDQDVLEILQRCFSERFDGGSNSRKGHAEPGRILHISRLCGELSVSRALGDRDFKAPPQSSWQIRNSDVSWKSSLFLPYPDNHSQTFFGNLISVIPEITFFQVGKEKDEFLILACDGLWDVMDCDDAVRITQDLLFRRGWSAKRVAIRLAELAIHLGSSDNVTVVIVVFNPT